MAETPADRRRSTRVPLNATAKLRILFPEETFRPSALDGTVEDISLAGVRVTVSGVNEDFHRLVIRAVRYAKVDLLLPGSESEIELQGRIVWVGYDNKRRVPSCSFGIMFEKLPDEARDQIQQFVQSIKI